MADNTGTNLGTKVRISMSAEVANDLDAFKKGVIEFAEAIGCPKCFSGLECTFESQREFLIGPRFDVRRLEPKHERATPVLAARQVTAPLSAEESFSLDDVLKRIDLVGNRLGRHWESGGLAFCCSGFDITFGQEARLRVEPF